MGAYASKKLTFQQFLSSIPFIIMLTGCAQIGIVAKQSTVIPNIVSGLIITSYGLPALIVIACVLIAIVALTPDGYGSLRGTVELRLSIDLQESFYTRGPHPLRSGVQWTTWVRYSIPSEVTITNS